MKIVFAGTPEFAVPAFEEIVKLFDVVAVLTQPDKPQGRKRILTSSPIKQAALAHDIPVLQPVKLREDMGELLSFGADLMVTCAYGQILSRETLDAFPMGVWNIHAGLLPAYRGAAPIAAAIAAREKETGVTVMRTDIGVDTGDIFLCSKLPIEENDTCGSLSLKLSKLGAKLICTALERIERGDVVFQKQGEGRVCRKVERTMIDFSKRADEVSALIRSLSPAPLAYAQMGERVINCYQASVADVESEEKPGTILEISPKKGLIVACGDGAVRISELQPAGGKRMADTAFANGKSINKGECFDKPVL